MPVVHLRNEWDLMSPLSFSTPIFIRKKNMTCAGPSAQLAADKLGYPIVFAGEAQKPCPVDQGVEWSHYRRRTLYDLLSATPVADGSGSEEAGVSGFLRPVCCIRDTSIMRRFVWRQNKLHRKPGISFLYRDFRPYWYDGINLSKELGLYRQKWCGCLLSRKEAEIQRARRAELKRQKALARMAALS